MDTVQSEKTSLKVVSQSLNETNSLMAETLEKLEFAVHGNTPKESPVATQEYQNGTLDHISMKMYEIARKASDISKLTSKIVGN